MTSITNNQTISDSYFNVDELPDGACISPKRIFPGNYKDGACTFKNVKVNLNGTSFICLRL